MFIFWYSASTFENIMYSGAVCLDRVRDQRAIIFIQQFVVSGHTGVAVGG